MANPNPSSITNTNPSSTTNTNAIAVATNAIAGPSTRSSSPSPSSSSSGWTDLPSDQEEMFYASDEDERERLRGQRRREWVDKLREERVRDREREERDKGREEVQAAAAKDLEEPSPDILTLMHHTATSLLASPNPRILELRIMTHHASDPRFNFLRGRHPLAWARIKAQVKVEKAKKEDPERIKREQGKVAGLVGGYESDSEDEDEDEGEPKDSPPPLPDDSQDPDPEELDGKDPVVRKDGKESVSRIDSHGSVISLHGDGSVIQVDGKGSVIQVHGKGPVIRVDGHGSVDDIMSTPPMTADQEASEEKKRIRRLKAEEWKRKRAQVAEER
ncbi:hypothetical protein BCR39DRAFT_518528 [Naematelia encephala]|uniref:Uncharacterized protein n=1 Tax=Naematelia encephala TaxID=71784 RepID=A0A1Y2BHQ7_9TREE|nr:hypothetical protein BCR39DRAFT_518528 [Naematelia encephala]